MLATENEITKCAVRSKNIKKLKVFGKILIVWINFQVNRKPL